MPSGRRVITQEFYTSILQAFRKAPENYRAVAKALKIDWKTAKRGWEEGWPRFTWAPPIKDVIRQEQVQVRVAAMEQADAAAASAPPARALTDVELQEHLKAAERLRSEAETMAADLKKAAEDEAAGIKRSAEEEAQARLKQAEIDAKRRLAELLSKAKIDAAQVAADQANMLNLSRKATIAAVALPALVLQDVASIAKMIREAIAGGAFKTPEQAVRVGALLTRMVENSERALHNHIQAENLHAGRPTDILGLSLSEETPVDEVEKKLRVVSRAIERAKARAQGTSPDGPQLPVTTNGAVQNGSGNPSVH